jgi:hypothetical protein
MSKRRVLLGGSFGNDSRLLRASHRVWGVPEGRCRVDGFRIVVSVTKGKIQKDVGVLRRCSLCHLTR